MSATATQQPRTTGVSHTTTFTGQHFFPDAQVIMSTSSAAPSDDTQRPLRASHSDINDHDEIMEVEDEVDDSSDSPNR
ncbi:hypothetical protein Patl1_10661 [Pistacia atlantica]|uniref:Uncharacterized protein n=1 Tax=Pistacia atlantica TaxID=434234 RepID=A0ACC1A2E6_9ROSI|nr:hypothetical protein Patl1_10661 [Pistacia atlantica]